MISPTTMSYRCSVAVLLSSIVTLAQGQGCPQDGNLCYGVDVSFPMHYQNVTSNFAWAPWNTDSKHHSTPAEYENEPIQPLGDIQSWYQEHIKGCVDYYGDKGQRCVQNEVERVEMSLRQPQSMINYTKYGYTKIKAPEKVFKLIKDFWELNKDKTYREKWPVGNTYTNHWSSPTHMVSVENRTLKGGGFILKQAIWNAARDTISEWTGQQLAECSLYGIRVYKEGSVLATHVDRLPLVSSAIINVAQDVDEEWPLEVIGHDGIAHNVTMEPGDLVLYESHSILHGRPFPLKGRFYANVFIHFEPIGPVGGDITYGTTDLPPYLIPGSPDEPNWRSRNPNGHSIMKPQDFAKGTTEAHKAAMEGDVRTLREVLEHHEDYISARDENGWQPIHEGVRNGNMDIIKILLDAGADVNSRTGEKQDDGSVLFWAVKLHGEDSDVSSLLKENGARMIKPARMQHREL